MCRATTDGPRHLPCIRVSAHDEHDGCVFDCGDVRDRHDGSEASDD